MARYKTSDGRIITIGSVLNSDGGYFKLSDIKNLGSDLFPYPIKFSGTKYCYDFIPSECQDFSLIGESSSYLIHFGFHTAKAVTVLFGYDKNNQDMSTSIRNDFDGYCTGNSSYPGGVLPLTQIFVRASEKPGEYTEAWISFLRIDNNNKINYFSETSSLPRLLSFLNDTKNLLAEPDSSPVADENGFFDSGSDAITLPGIDSINVGSALQSSGVKAHKVDITEINKFFGTLWSTDFFDTIIKKQQAPIDNILSMSTYPYDVHDNGISKEIKVGTVSMGATGKLITAQFQEIDFGSIDCKEYYGNSLDYTYTDVDIFLPFIGTKSLDVNIIGGAVVSLVYRVDILTGNCDAIISAKRNRDGTELNSVLYIFSGNLQNQIPLTQQQNQTLLKLESAIQTTIQGAVMGNPKGGAAGGVAGLATEGMTMALTGQPTTRYQMSGNLSTANGYMGVLTPYLIWYRPVNVKPSSYDKYYGYPSFFTRKLSDCSGYTKVHELISDAPTGVPADDWETIKQMLKDGIIIN